MPQVWLKSIISETKERMRQQQALPFIVLVKNAYQTFLFELEMSNEEEKALNFHLLSLALSYINASEYVIVTEGWASQPVTDNGKIRFKGKKEVVLVTRVQREGESETTNSGHLFDISRDDEGRFLDLIEQEALSAGLGILTGLFLPKTFTLSAEQRQVAEAFVRELAEKITFQ